MERNLSIFLNGYKIDIGVILDEQLSWKPHISHVARKISKSVGIIYKASFCLSNASLYKLNVLFSSLSLLTILYNCMRFYIPNKS